MREVETELRRELSLVEPLRGGNLEVAKRIAAARNPVSLHLRRGDYSRFSSSLTISWWGASLNPHCDKQVIVPTRWLGFDTTGTAIACPEWTLLDAELRRRPMPVAPRA